MADSKDKKVKVSIYDVAKEAGVSVSTVSRVIRKYSNVTKDTEIKVNAAIKKLKYIPNAAASRLGSGSLNNIGVVFTRSADQAFHNPFFSEILMGIGHVLEEYDYNMQLIMCNDIEVEREKVMGALSSGMISGAILLITRVYDKLIQDLANSQYPFVVSGKVEGIVSNKPIYSVNTDNIDDSFTIVDHLAKLGHKKIAILNGPKEYAVNKDRHDGYRRALLMNGLTYDDGLDIQGGYTLDDAKDAVMKKLIERQDITAIFAKDDMKAIAAMQGIREMGYSIPEDIAIVGYNDFEIAKIAEPKLTTIKVPVYALGVEAATMLMKLINKEEMTDDSLILDTELIVRESCGYKEKTV
jgi:DNA-binding LacI/PurR family transcriptional regulator